MNLKGSDYSDIKNAYLKFLKKREIKKSKPIVDKVGKFNKFYLPLSNWIYSQYKKNNEIKIIGLSGGQGAGKSTITSILKFILKKRYGLDLCVFSIDDFYKTKSERRKMSKKVHPLFLTRGVPGTHDVKLINKTFKSLKKKFFKPVLIPRFNKLIDDRHQKSKWIKIKIMFTKTRIRNSTECIGFRALMTTKADVKIILENKKNNISKDIKILLL